VETSEEIREFLTSRRARITPEQAGLQLERGNASGVSETVLEALARALQLDEAERAHLFDLARAQSTTARPRRRRAPQRVRPGVQRLLDSKSEEALNLLASWTATPDQPRPAAAPNR
jgi:hypothetical protein